MAVTFFFKFTYFSSIVTFHSVCVLFHISARSELNVGRSYHQIKREQMGQNMKVKSKMCAQCKCSSQFTTFDQMFETQRKVKKLQSDWLG